MFGLHVTLQSVNLFTSGLFGCEASADKSYHTELTRRKMTVVGESGGYKQTETSVCRYVRHHMYKSCLCTNIQNFVDFWPMDSSSFSLE